MNFAIKRLNIGGKLLTNALKETLCFRAYNLRDEFAIVNSIKESLCFVSSDFNHDLKLVLEKYNPISREYVLPNGSSILTGRVRVCNKLCCCAFQDVSETGALLGKEDVCIFDWLILS